MAQETKRFDLLIIGGGINGAGIARDAAGRGLSVLLVEQNDLASGTSSKSSKLIHGGLRYLETFQFRLVHEALKEREVLMRIAPHIVKPLRFILPEVPQMRPSWMIRMGLFIYDYLGGKTTLPSSGRLKLQYEPEGQPLQSQYIQGYHYADCWVEDSRLVILNAMDAAQRGAVIRTRTQVQGLRCEHGVWLARLLNTETGQLEEVSAHMVANAAGPWVGDILAQSHYQHTKTTTPTAKPPIRLVKGSHIVLPRLYKGDWAYLCQNDDGRIIFCLPFEDDFTLVGTTDIPFEGDPSHAQCSEEEEQYLLSVVRRFFKQDISSHSIIHRFAGVRSLYDDGASKAKDVTRDYVLKLEKDPAPILTLYGGKITTYRRLAEQAVNLLQKQLRTNDRRREATPWTDSTPLPGGVMGQSLDQYIQTMQRKYTWIPPLLLARWCKYYGSRTSILIGDAKSIADFGNELAPELYEIEANYLKAHEFAHTLEDILWRRTRLGLRHK